LARSAADVEEAVATLRYPPHGTRGFGPFVASSCHDFDMVQAVAHYKSNPPVCYVLVETAEAVDNIEEIVEVEGVDVLQVAQFDLSTALGISGQFDHPRFLEAERHIEASVRKAGKAKLGAVALTRERAHELHARGYRVVVGFDLWWLKESIRETQRWVEE
jgi:4-hydroxy-2-oxoheptanedioate aldolase